MKIIGLTGPSGAGKGLACRIFARYGIPAIDTDGIYHTLLTQKGAMTDELTKAFGADILSPEGLVDRKRLAQTVFGHPDTDVRLHTLNTITHKYIMAKAHEQVQMHARAGARGVLIDAPQLFEAHIENECDLVLGILADRETRIARICARDGIDRAAAERRIDAQKSDDYFRAHCHCILENDADEAALEAAIRTFLENSGLGL